MLKRIILLEMVVLILLSGCTVAKSKDNGRNSNDRDNEIIDIGSRPIFDIPHRERPEELFPEFQNMHPEVAPYGNGLYVYATTKEQPEEWKIYFCNLDNGKVTQSESQISDFMLSQFHAMSDDSLLVGGYPYSNSYHIYHLAGQKTELIIEFSEEFFVVDIAVNENKGCIYVNAEINQDSFIYVYSLTGQLLYEVTSDAFINDIIYSEQQSTLYLIHYTDEDLHVLLLDEEHKTIREVTNLPEAVIGTSIFPSDEYGFYLVFQSNVLGFDSDSYEFMELFNLTTQGISDMVRHLFMYDERYIVYSYDVAESIPKITSLIILDDYDGPVEKMRLGKFEIGRDVFLESVVADFNFYNPQYLVEIIDYSVHGDEAVFMLHMDIISGEAPDIFILTEPLAQSHFLPIHQYINSGMLVNIAPYMERDLDFDSLWSGALQSIYIDNACYIAVPSFALYGIVGKSDMVNSLEKESFDDFLAYLNYDFTKERPMFTSNLAQTDFVVDLILTNIEHFVNYNTGDAFFDSSTFIALLEAVKSYTSEEEEWDALQLSRGLGQFTFLQYDTCGLLATYSSVLNNDFTVSGFPGNPSGVALVPKHIFGISSATQCIEGAWAFLRNIYENEDLHENLYTRFPMNRVSFERASNDYVDLIMEYIAEEGDGYYLHGNSFATLVPHVDPVEIVNHTRSMIEQIDRVYLVDQVLINIVLEELTAFIAGNRSAADTAHIIQSRAQTYLWELR